MDHFHVVKMFGQKNVSTRLKLGKSIDKMGITNYEWQIGVSGLPEARGSHEHDTARYSQVGHLGNQ